MLGEAFRGVVPDPVRARVYALEAEQRVALDWTAAHAPDLHTRVAAALGLVLTNTGRAREAYTELGSALERSGISGAAGGWAAVLRAYAAESLGFAAEGAPLIEPGLVALRSTGDEALLEAGLRVAGVFWLFADEPERSLEHASEALGIARRRSHLGDLAVELVGQAQTLVALGHLDEAEGLLDEAAPLVSELGDSTLDPSDLYADIAVERRNWALAARSYSEGA